MWWVYLKGWNWLTIIIGLLQVARPGGGAGLCALRSDVCNKSGIAPEPRVVGGGLELGVVVTKSDCARTAIIHTTWVVV